VLLAAVVEVAVICRYLGGARVVFVQIVVNRFSAYRGW